VTEIPKIHSVSMEDKKRALSSMFMAFTSDPLARWFAPEADQYFSGGIELMEAFGGKAFENGTAFASSGYEGVSFWFPPGVEADEDQLNKAIEKLAPSDRMDLRWLEGFRSALLRLFIPCCALRGEANVGSSQIPKRLRWHAGEPLSRSRRDWNGRLL